MSYLTIFVSKKVNDATDNDTSNLGVKRDFIVLKVEVAKLDINNFVNIPTGLKNEKADDLEIDNWYSCKFEKTSKERNNLSKEIVKKTTVYNKLKWNKWI